MEGIRVVGLRPTKIDWASMQPGDVVYIRDLYPAMMVDRVLRTRADARCRRPDVRKIGHFAVARADSGDRAGELVIVCKSRVEAGA